jgi:hypothetical protein
MNTYVYIPTKDFEYGLDLAPALAETEQRTPGDLWRCPHGHQSTYAGARHAPCRHDAACRPVLVACVRESVPLPSTAGKERKK